MPPGRKPNLDKRITDLIGQLKTAIFEREKVRLESQVEALVGNLQADIQGGNAQASPDRSSLAGRGNRRQRSPASRAAQSKKMKAYWAAKRKAGGKKKPRKTKPAAPAAVATEK